MNIKDGYKYDDDLPRDPKKSKKKPNTSKIEKMEKCIKDKDKRISKLEDRWESIKTTVLFVSSIVFIGLIVGILIYFGFTQQNLLTDIMTALGVITTIYFICWFSVFIIIASIDGAIDKDLLVFSAGVATGLSVLIGIVIMMMWVVPLV